MGRRGITILCVRIALYVFVHSVLDSIERNGNGESGRVGDVEGFYSFGSVDMTSTGNDVGENRVMDLHTLFYY